MSKRQKLDASALQSALSPGRAPASFDRAGRVKLIGEAAQALLAGRLPGREAALFLGAALLAWLEQGGDLSREYLKVIVNGSHLTPDRVWKSLQSPPFKGTTGPDDEGTIEPSSPEEGEQT